MNIFKNRYAETQYKIPFTKKLITNDIDAYKHNPKHRYIYNKYWVTKSQGIECGTMTQTPSRENFPVFIKPIINLRGGNRDCYKINTIEKFNQYKERDDMFWSIYINDKEASTDFLLHNGKIIFENTYLIENQKDSFLQNISRFSPNNTCPFNIKEWVQYNLSDYTGPVNIQYRGNKIIECGLRFDAAGNFIQWCGNSNIIYNINNFIEKGIWKTLTKQEMHFKDKYYIVCVKSYPIIYYIPAPLLLYITELNNIEKCKFYIDRTKDKITFFSMLDEDKEKLIKTKQTIELVMNLLNYFFIIGFLFYISLFVFLFFSKKNIHRNISITFMVFLLLFITRFINPPKYLRRIM